jgi:epoxyqueuosine reductase
MQGRAELVLEAAREQGFDLAGIAPLAPPPALPRFRAWLAAGHHADMTWLERHAQRIADPRALVPGARSLLVVGKSHARPAVALDGGGRVARYAAGRDYHHAMVRALRRLARRLEREGLLGRWRQVVDAGPLLERSHAAVARLGFESKSANLLNPHLGPWFFLGELVIDAELAPSGGPDLGSCGTCNACIEACPTQALRAPGVVDSRLCLSYQTIENRGAVPRALRHAAGEWAFGCDVCSEVCPFGRRAADTSASWGTHPALAGTLVDWLRHRPEEHAERFRGSALRRAQRAGLARNAALALARHPSEEGREALLAALASDPSPRVREAAGWALAQAHAADRGVRSALELAHERERAPDARADLAETVAGLPGVR